MPDLSPENVRVLQYLLEECHRRIAAWRSHEARERRVLWVCRVLLLAPLSGAVLAASSMADAQDFTRVAMMGIVTYLQVTIFFVLFRQCEGRWAEYVNHGAALEVDRKNLERALSENTPPGCAGQNCEVTK